MSALQTPTGEARFESIEQAYLALKPVMSAIVSAVGPHCEVVLHDLSARDLDHSIYAIENGHVTGRVVGGPSTNLGLEVLKDPSANHDAFGYRGRTADGRELLSSSVYYRDTEGRVIAALCVNVDLTPLQTVSSLLSALIPSRKTAEDDPREVVSPDINSVLDRMIDEAIDSVGKMTTTMDKSDRIAVLRHLQERGAFAIKRAADIVAKRLGVSRVTVYGYLDEVRNGS